MADARTCDVVEAIRLFKLIANRSLKNMEIYLTLYSLKYKTTM